MMMLNRYISRGAQVVIKLPIIATMYILFGCAADESTTAPAPTTTAAIQHTKAPTHDVDGIAAGKAVYEQMCASCHGKDLGGASGFNLKDGEWVHGRQPADIVSNIKKGFLNAGMPGFENLLTDAQIEHVVAFILSRREGFDGLTYKLYQMNDTADTAIDESKLVKEGTIANSLADFQIPEVSDYVIVFEGDFFVPDDAPANIWVEWGKIYDITFEVDSEKAPQISDPWIPLWPIKAGKQHLKITFKSGESKPDQRNPPIIVVNEDNTIKRFAASTRAKAIMDGKKYDIKAANKSVVTRKKIHSLPSYSISVGLPQKINYAFNTRSCGIVGLWVGDMLNIGPNIEGRGLDGSLILGDWVFSETQAVELTTDKSGSKCRYRGYSVSGEPIFNYQQNGANFTLSARASSARTIHFDFTTEHKGALEYQLPVAESLSWQSEQGEIKNNIAAITPTDGGKFTLTATIKN